MKVPLSFVAIATLFLSCANSRYTVTSPCRVSRQIRNNQQVLVRGAQTYGMGDQEAVSGDPQGQQWMREGRQLQLWGTAGLVAGIVGAGVAASGGRHRGAARLVWGTEDFKKMKAGNVLVCRSSNVSWIPLFTIAGAVITEVGGALSHAAVVAREFGVPAVVGVGVAFERLRDGMIVEVDGDRGTVRPISATSVRE